MGVYIILVGILEVLGGGGGRFVLKKWKFWEGEGLLSKIYCVAGLWISSGFYIVHLEHSNN